MLRFLARVLKRSAFVLLVLAILFGTFVTYLGVTTAEPRASDVWTRLADLPNPRGETAAAVGARLAEECPSGGACESQLLVMGGIAGLGRTVDLVDVFDPVLGTWSVGPPLPEPRHHPAAAGLGGVVYVSGGSRRTTAWEPESNFWRLDPTSSEWIELPPMPDGRMGHAMVPYEQKLYVVGGRGQTLNVQIFDTITQTWSTGAELPERRDHLGVALAGFTIYAIGGRDDALTSRVDVYDIVEDSWTEGPALPEPMSAMAVGTLPDGIHVVGGEEPKTIGGRVIDRHYVLAPGGTQWLEAPLPILATHGSGAAVLRGSLVVAGGARRQGALSPLGWTGLVEVYEPDATPRPSPSPSGS